MANIDVSELLLDPDFVDAFTVVRTAVVVGSNGIAAQTETQIPGVLGSVQPAGGTTLANLPEATRAEGVKEVWTQFALRGPVEGGEPDRILWQGKRLIVFKSDEYGHFGSGYYHAVLTIEGTTDG